MAISSLPIFAMSSAWTLLMSRMPGDSIQRGADRETGDAAARSTASIRGIPSSLSWLLAARVVCGCVKDTTNSQRLC
jgi:hypothetical protein